MAELKRVRPEEESTDPDVHGPWPEEEQSARKKPGSYLREHPGVKWALVAAVLVIAIGAFLVWSYYSVRESTDDAQIDGHITPISSRVAGTVVAVNFNDNQTVNAGDVLVKLDPTDYDIARQRAMADFNEAQSSARAAQTSIPISNVSTASQLATANALRVAAQREVEAARARVREAQANFTRVSRDLERMKQLIAKDEISRQQYDAAVAAEEAARATLDAVQANVATAESHVAQAEAGVRNAQTAPEQVSVTRARFGSASALTERAQAALKMAQQNLVYTDIKAPSTGVVSKRNVEVGQVIQPGQPLCSLVDVQDVWVTANFKETQLREMKVGQPVTVKVDAYDHELKGHIDSFGGATGARFSLLPPENATGNYVKVVQRVPVKIVFEKGEDPKHVLRPGMSVVPTVITK